MALWWGQSDFIELMAIALLRCSCIYANPASFWSNHLLTQGVNLSIGSRLTHAVRRLVVPKDISAQHSPKLQCSGKRLNHTENLHH